jgi:hypothetical protein
MWTVTGAEDVLRQMQYTGEKEKAAGGLLPAAYRECHAIGFS